MKKLKHAKRLLSLMLAITMVVTALPSTSITSLASPVSETLETQPEPTTSGNGEDQTQDNDKKSDSTVSDESTPTAPEGENKTPAGDESNKDESNTVDDQGQGSNDVKNPDTEETDSDSADPADEKKPDGRVEKWLEYKEELIESPNPLWNANLNSRALDRSFGVTNNFSAEYNPLTSLKIRGRFGITKTINESDDFLSPEDTSFDDTEELKKGSLAYQNGKNLQYEGELKWNENGDYSGVFICSGILIPICRYVDLLAD